VNTQIKALELQIAGQLATCADGHSFTSLPSTEQIFGAAVDNNTYLMCRDSYSAIWPSSQRSGNCSWSP
jgi:hypothetical protein